MVVIINFKGSDWIIVQFEEVIQWCFGNFNFKCGCMVFDFKVLCVCIEELC